MGPSAFEASPAGVVPAAIAQCHHVGALFVADGGNCSARTQRHLEAMSKRWPDGDDRPPMLPYARSSHRATMAPAASADAMDPAHHCLNPSIPRDRAGEPIGASELSPM